MQAFHEKTAGMKTKLRHFFREPQPVTILDRLGNPIEVKRFCTVAVVIDEENMSIAIATAIVNEIDKPVKKIGRAIAIGRAKKMIANETGLIPIGFPYAGELDAPRGDAEDFIQNILDRYLDK